MRQRVVFIIARDQVWRHFQKVRERGVRVVVVVLWWRDGTLFLESAVVEGWRWRGVLVIDVGLLVDNMDFGGVAPLQRRDGCIVRLVPFPFWFLPR